MSKIFEFIAGIRNFLSGKKTYIAAFVVALQAVVSWSTGDVSTAELVTQIAGAFGLGSLRAGVKKDSKK